MERRKLEEAARKKAEEEAIARKKFEGTRVTVESFLVWKEKFDAELESLKSAAQRKAELEMKGRMTGNISFFYSVENPFFRKTAVPFQTRRRRRRSQARYCKPGPS